MESMPARTDWDPRAPDVLDDQLRAYDGMRRGCPIAHSEALQWTLFRHADVLRVLLDAPHFGNAVSARQSIPNGMDDYEHATWRALVEPFFAPERLAAFEPVARAVARDMVARLPAGEVEWMGQFADECAVRRLCGFMGWGDDLRTPRCASGRAATRPPRAPAIAPPWRRWPSSSTATSARNSPCGATWLATIPPAGCCVPPWTAGRCATRRS